MKGLVNRARTVLTNVTSSALVSALSVYACSRTKPLSKRRMLYSHTTPYRTYYLQLRMMINEHLRSGFVPQLALSGKPTGAFIWRPQQPAEENIEEFQLVNDGPDVGIEQMKT